jgi:hypothetical protein
VTAVFLGVVLSVLYFINGRVLSRISGTNPWASRIPLARRMNTGIAICGIALVVLGLLVPQI